MLPSPEVVPHEGTWIEIEMRGGYNDDYSVVPHEGTWIEIRLPSYQHPIISVVPHEGTWIEMSVISLISRYSKSFPTRERGLKYKLRQVQVRTGQRRSPRGNVD